MTTTYDLPLPNDMIGNETVIASCYVLDDDPQNTWGLFILMRKESPYYHVAEMRLGHEDSLTTHAVVKNINEATAVYSDNGGDI